MELKITIRVAVVLFLSGFIFFYLFSSIESAAWFSVGGAMALVNLSSAAWIIRQGFKSLPSKAFFLGVLLLKSLAFVFLVGFVLVFLKPQLLPFTLGVGGVIFGSIGAAVLETRHYMSRQNDVNRQNGIA
jgi:hypothetical protein